MKSINRLLILTIIFNFFILIGAGHGIGFLGLIEVIGLKAFFQGDVKFSLRGSYDDRLFTAATIAIVGQIILVFAYFQRQKLKKFRVVYVGLCILFFSFIILTKDILNSSLDSFSFWSGTPFLVFSILLLLRTIRNEKLTIN